MVLTLQLTQKISIFWLKSINSLHFNTQVILKVKNNKSLLEATILSNNFYKGEKIMSSLIWVCWQTLKNTCTSCKILSLKCINKPQHLYRKVHKQIQKGSLGKIFLKGRKLRKTGQNHSPELISPPSKTPVKSLVQLTGTGAASQVYINCIQDRQWLKKSAQLLFERTLSSRICPITTVQNVLKQKLHNPAWPAIWEFKDKEHFSA